MMRPYSAPMRRVPVVLIASLLVITACADSRDGTTGEPATTGTTLSTVATTLTPTTLTPTTGDPAIVTPTTVTATTLPPTTGDPTIDRPFEVFTPSGYDGSVSVPLVISLHGYSVNGDMQEQFLRLRPLAEERGFLLVHPDGTINELGRYYWNATDACCGFGISTVDDSGYLASVIDHVQATYNVDPKRIFLVGFSNGGFMSYRMACDHADKIAAIVSISGASFLDPAACAPSEPVNVLEIHGTDDDTIGYYGGAFLGADHPGAEQSVADWAAYNGCTGAPIVAPTTLDLDATIEGAESVVTQFGGCPQGGTTELWTINGGTHVPELSTTFRYDVIDFLLAHPKP